MDITTGWIIAGGAIGMALTVTMYAVISFSSNRKVKKARNSDRITVDPTFDFTMICKELMKKTPAARERFLGTYCSMLNDHELKKVVMAVVDEQEVRVAAEVARRKLDMITIKNKRREHKTDKRTEWDSHTETGV